MGKSPKISIGVPVYNGENYLAEALESLLAQTFTDFEIIICDNASTDGTEQICKDFEKRDERICYFRNECNLGFTANFNKAFERSKAAPYFKWMAHDDKIAPDFLGECLKVMEEHEDIVACQARERIIDENGDEFSYDERTGLFTRQDGRQTVKAEPPTIANQEAPYERVQDLLRNSQRYYHIFGLIRADALKKTALFRPYYEADGALLVELALQGKFHTLGSRLHYKREHPDTSYEQTPEERARRACTAMKFSRVKGKWAQFTGYLDAVWRSSVGLWTKLLCTVAILRHGCRSIRTWLWLSLKGGKG